ncbi:MAG: primosomal protein N', partial [Acidobacteriota bacterium]
MRSSTTKPDQVLGQTDQAPIERVVAVAVPVPGLGLLSYRVPDGMRSPPKGARVSVPLGSRLVVGCVVDADIPAPEGALLKAVAAVIDEEPFLPATIMDLAVWVGDYYASGPGDALGVAMPPAARDGLASSFRTARVAEAVGDVTADSGLTGERQREGMALLRARPDGVAVAELQKGGVSAATLKALERRGLVRFRQEVVERDPFVSVVDGEATWTMGKPPTGARQLTDEQRAAMATLETAADAQTFRPVLLHGVTGSGKTELYLRLASHVIGAGRRVLVLVPEIALTPAVAGLFRARFGSRVAIQHSGLSDGERHDQWHRIRRGEIDLVVGTRSAVFAPLDRLGLIVVDEEHETAYKQEESPRYHGRDVAVMRARMEGALVVMGTATPSLESATNAQSGRYELVRLKRRVLDRPLAAVEIVDMRREFAAHGANVTFGQTLLAAIALRLERHEQTLVLLNRRGFASVVFCRQCGASMECPHCSVTLTFHRGARRMRCHYCNYAVGVAKECAAC